MVVPIIADTSILQQNTSTTLPTATKEYLADCRLPTRRCENAPMPMSKIISINIIHSTLLLSAIISATLSSLQRRILRNPQLTRWRFRFVGTWSLTKPNRWTLQALLPGIPPLPSFRAEVYADPVSLTMSEEESKNRIPHVLDVCIRPILGTRRTKNEKRKTKRLQVQPNRCIDGVALLLFQRLRRHLMPLSGQLNRRILSFLKMRSGMLLLAFKNDSVSFV